MDDIGEQPWLGRLRTSGSLAAARWIPPRLTGPPGTVGGTVPSGFAAYARIPHPVQDAEHHPATWTDVARATGRCAHPLAQWHALVGSADPWNFAGSLWPGTDPGRGSLDEPVLSALLPVLARHTSTPGQCWFAYWIGWSSIGPADPPPPRADEYGQYASTAGHVFFDRAAGTDGDDRLLHLPNREYELVHGPLEAVVDADQSPGLWWPQDRAWCVASEVDFDSTLVGGTAELAEAVLRAPGVEAWAVGLADSLRASGDHVNQLPSTVP